MNVLTGIAAFLYAVTVLSVHGGGLILLGVVVKMAAYGAAYASVAKNTTWLPQPSRPGVNEWIDEDIEDEFDDWDNVSFLGPGKPDFMELITRGRR